MQWYSLFLAHGPATLKALLPSNMRVLGTSTDSVSADRRPDLRPIDEVGRTRSVRYDCHLSCMDPDCLLLIYVSTGNFTKFCNHV